MRCTRLGRTGIFAQALSLSERNGWARLVSMQNHYNLIYREEARQITQVTEEPILAYSGDTIVGSPETWRGYHAAVYGRP